MKKKFGGVVKRMSQSYKEVKEQLYQYLQEIDEATSLDDEDAIQDKILELARNDPEQFVEVVQNLPVDDTWPLHDIYEALSLDAAAWAEFYISEIDRLVDLARSDPEPARILSPLDEYFVLTFDDDLMELQGALLQKFYENCDDENEAIRRKCVVLLGDFAGRKDFKALYKLERLAAKDPDWRIRYLAFEALDDIQPKQAQRVKLPLWIRLRARLSNTILED
jgi:hypothetical protein